MVKKLNGRDMLFGVWLGTHATVRELVGALMYDGMSVTMTCTCIDVSGNGPWRGIDGSTGNIFVPISAWQLSLTFWRELIQLPALYYRAKQSFPHSQHMA